MPSSSPLSFPQNLIAKLPQPLARYAEAGFRLFSGKSARLGYLAALEQGEISIANFLAALILARAVDPTEFGVYAVGFLMTRFVRAIQDGLTVQPINALGAPLDEANFRIYATNTGLIQLGLACASAAAAALIGWGLTAAGNDVAGPTVSALWFVLLTWQLQEYLRRVFYTRNQIMASLVISTLADVVRLFLLWNWNQQNSLSGKAGLDAIAWGGLAAVALGLWLARHYWTFRKITFWQTLRQNWKFGGWITGGSLANWVASELYPLLAAGLISFAAAGAYRALQNLVAPVHVLLRATDSFFTPRAARIYSETGFQGLGRMLKIIYLVSGIPILGLLMLASLLPEPLLRLLYGETYVAYSGGLFLMAIYYALWYAYWPLQTAFKAIRITRPIFTANIAAIVCMFTIGVWAIQHWDVFGAIGGQALNALVIALVLWVSWLKVTKEKDNRA
jgi:O-antigen/teichoic acid export membrane protein